ncbi:hypothetical protein L2E82_16435 [Cichorium intybus]|uniref:Uncharacterized protein n=1 Tax=Cichorium intybus TaxID=13427 RepID=A0ACB9F5K1_CICIN|nr:hypothetical protein L2E82_16435 [Cichorium intybus]
MYIRRSFSYVLPPSRRFFYALVTYLGWPVWLRGVRPYLSGEHCPHLRAHHIIDLAQAAPHQILIPLIVLPLFGIISKYNGQLEGGRMCSR